MEREGRSGEGGKEWEGRGGVERMGRERREEGGEAVGRWEERSEQGRGKKQR